MDEDEVHAMLREDEVPEPQVITDAQPRKRRSFRWFVPLGGMVVVGLAVAAAVASGAGGNVAHGVSTRIELESNRISGAPVEGSLIVENSTGHAIVLRDNMGCAEKFQVVLQGDHARQDPIFTTECSAHATTIPDGTTRLSIEVRPDYSGCVAVPTALHNTDATPACQADGGTPLLPPGTYRAVLAGNLDLPAPPAVSVVVG